MKDMKIKIEYEHQSINSIRPELVINVRNVAKQFFIWYTLKIFNPSASAPTASSKENMMESEFSDPMSPFFGRFSLKSH